jgi:serine/threonine protein kinase
MDSQPRLSSPKEIARGRFGRVYKKWKCENDTKLKRELGDNYVTKKLIKDAGLSEQKNYENINKIIREAKIKIENPEQYYILKQEECLYTADPIHKYLSYANGGESLQSLLKNREEEVTDYRNDKSSTLPCPDSDFYKNIFLGLLNLVIGINLLNSNHIFIFDLKPGNIVYDGKVFKLIDLDSLRPVLETLSQTDYSKLPLAGTIPYLAPETNIYYAIEDNSLSDIFKIDQEDPEFLKVLVKKQNESLKTEIDTIIKPDFLKVKKEASPFDRVHKIDMWALGLILLELYSNFYSEQTQGIPLSTLKMDNLFENIIKPLLKLNFNERLNSIKALRAYGDWVDTFGKKTTPQSKKASALAAPGKVSGGRHTRRRRRRTRSSKRRSRLRHTVKHRRTRKYIH